MTCCEVSVTWTDFLNCAKERCSGAAFNNWLAPIRLIEESTEEITLEVPNIFIKEYLYSNFLEELRALVPLRASGEPAINFVIAKSEPTEKEEAAEKKPAAKTHSGYTTLNSGYSFDSFIDGPINQFAKSAALGVANRPGELYNPLFIHGDVGLGKTHLLHSIGHAIQKSNRQIRVQCVTTESLINEFVKSLRATRSLDKVKRFYRNDVDVLLVDDIQFLQNLKNFEDEFCSTFEALIHQKKQIVITSDKSPQQLDLSTRLVGRMEWGLVVQISPPDVETRVAILEDKAKKRGIKIPQDVAFWIAERLTRNIRQLEGAVNRLSAQAQLLDIPITQEIAEHILRDFVQPVAQKKITVEQVLQVVQQAFNVTIEDLKGNSRMQKIAIARQAAMYLACRTNKGTLQTIAGEFGKTHSTLLHACKAVEKKMESNPSLTEQLAKLEKLLSC
ncbi:MAG: chromosomal replication initiator protein DnaA [Waddliaceae bacterium]